MARLRQRYHGVAQNAAVHEGWIAQLSETARAEFHQVGESLLAHLSAYVTATSPRTRRAALLVASQIGGRYGQLCRSTGLDTPQTVEAYVRFRRPLLDVLGRLLAAHPEQSGALSRLMRDAEGFLDAILESVVAAPSGAEGLDPPEGRS